MRRLLTASVAMVGTLATFKLMLDYSSWKKARHSERKKRRKSGSFIHDGLPSDSQLLDACYGAIQNLQQQHNVDRGASERLLSWLRGLKRNMSIYSAKTRLLSAQWLELYTMNRCAHAKSPEAYQAMVEEHTPDLEIAWRLLQCSPEDPDEQVAVRLLALKIATRLKSHERMIPIFDGIIERVNSGRVILQEAFAAFMAAPILGRWKAARRLGKYAISGGIKLEDLHKNAQQNPAILDMKVLYELAEEEIPGLTDEQISIAEIRWTEYLIKGLRIKVDSVECDDEKKRQEVQKNFQTKIQTWKVIQIPSQTKILRSGAVVQMLSFSVHPIPMSGPATDKRMLVRGYTDTTGGLRSEEISIQSDPDKNELWQGQYLCIQEDLPRVTLRINIEMTLEEQKPSAPDKKEPESKGCHDSKTQHTRAHTHARTL